MPAKAGIQDYLKILDSRLRGNDAKRCFKAFYETIKIEYVRYSIAVIEPADMILFLVVGNLIFEFVSNFDISHSKGR